MYVPKPFAVQDSRELVAFIEREPFGVLVSDVDGKPFATHLPFVVLEDGPGLTLGLHLAKPNPQWQTLEGQDVLAIFQGAHAFVSAAWYPQPGLNVPTWNYAAVHCAGRANIADSAQTMRILERLVERFEPSWRIENADGAYIEMLRTGIVGVTIEVTAVEGAFKFLQNHPPEDRERVIAALDASSRPMDREVAREMRTRLR